MESKLRVFYGFTKLNKISKKRELAVFFENQWRHNSKEWISQRMEIAYTRFQTEDEAIDGKPYTRCYAKYSIFFDDKPFNGDIEKALEFNKQSDIKNVSENTLKEIYDACKETYKRIYPFFKSQLKSTPKQLLLF
ncbi:MAG: hypothetical protein WCG93_12050 [Paludibacter sp.]